LVDLEEIKEFYAKQLGGLEIILQIASLLSVKRSRPLGRT